MHLLRTYLLSIIAIIVTYSPAQAYTVDYFFVGDDLNMGLLATEQNGAINYGSIFAAQRTTIGQLRARSRITFTFTFNGGLDDSAYNILSGSYDYTNSAGDRFTGVTSSERLIDSTSPIATDTASGQVNSVVDTALLLATSDMVKGQSTVALTVSNESDGIANFTNIMRILANNPIIASARYNVTAIPNVPLPAALPLFGLVIGSFFGVARLRRRTGRA